MSQTQNVGKIVQIIGPVLDIEFEPGALPEIYNALRVVSDGRDGVAGIDVIAEVEQHLGADVITSAEQCLAHKLSSKHTERVVGTRSRPGARH